MAFEFFHQSKLTITGHVLVQNIQKVNDQDFNTQIPLCIFKMRYNIILFTIFQYPYLEKALSSMWKFVKLNLQ